MHNARCVGRRQHRGQLTRDAQDIALTHAALTVQMNGQVVTRQILHHQVGAAVGKVAVLGNLDQPFVADQVYGFGLIEKPRYSLGRVRVARVQDLDRDAMTLIRRNRFINCAHTALSQRSRYLIRANAAIGHSDSPVEHYQARAERLQSQQNQRLQHREAKFPLKSYFASAIEIHHYLQHKIPSLAFLLTANSKVYLAPGRVLVSQTQVGSLRQSRAR